MKFLIYDFETFKGILNGIFGKESDVVHNGEHFLVTSNGEEVKYEKVKDELERRNNCKIHGFKIVEEVEGMEDVNDDVIIFTIS